ncbi:MAG: fructose bisphosphate aldolase [Actinobacteria bacterium]|nr:fructose bisphosphate aldolase [Actinomycetota bacterium]
MNAHQREIMRTGNGFIAALDQSGGSTPKALALYGLDASTYSSEAEMFDRVHDMRTRIIKSAAFNSDHILGAILFEMTMQREIDGIGTAEFLWQKKNIVPFLKIDVGLDEERNGVSTMKPITGLEERLLRAKDHGIFGTKMRSVIKLANPAGIGAVLAQQFALARDICSLDLVPIIEPEVDIKSLEKLEAELLLRDGLVTHLDSLGETQLVMLKLTIPTQDNFYSEIVHHPRVLRVVALSGGYSRDMANELLAKNTGLIASFSRALTEGLTAQQSDSEFDSQLSNSVMSIYSASTIKSNQVR